MKNNKKKKKSKKLRLKKEILIIILFLIPIPVLIFSTINIINYVIDSPKSKEVISNIVENTKIINYDSKDAKIIENNEKPNTPYWNYIKMDLIDVDFKKLKKINNDTAGWLYVEGTNINYPFVQTDDNDFYLTHSFDKTQNNAGWLFLDYRNNKNEYERNTIIYAHNRKDKTMFGTLKNLITNDWFKNENNRIIKMSSEKNNTLWQIFSVYTIETTNDYIKTYFIDDKDYLNFLNMLKDRSYKNFNTSISENDKILTLSTCHGNTKKLVVHAKLIKIEAK